MKKRENIYITRIIEAFEANIGAFAKETQPLSCDTRTAYFDKEHKEPAAAAACPGACLSGENRSGRPQKRA